MRLKNYYFILAILWISTISSCERQSNTRDNQETQNQNQLYVTEKGDSLETGYWIFEIGPNGVSSAGSFKDGFRDGPWKYKTNRDSVSITWSVFKKDSLKLNLPGNITLTNQELPVVFLGTIRNNNEHCYYTLLNYNLKEVKASVYDYIFQYIQSLENGTSETLKTREVKKFTFNGTEVFQVKVDLEAEHKYQVISYIFVHNDTLYDLTYRDESTRVGDIQLEIFMDILYSFQTKDFDPFNFNNKQYTKEENVDIRTPLQN